MGVMCALRFIENIYIGSIIGLQRQVVQSFLSCSLVTVRAFLGEFATRLGARPPRRVPTWLARWLAGEQAVAYFTRSTRTTNARLQRDFAWTPRYPTYREGLHQIVAAWNAESSRAAVASAAGG